MSSRRALVLETNPVITERYIEYTNDSDWRVMLKDTLNDFLEKLQKENFDLVVAEESILPQGIIGMLRSVGVPFLLSSNTKNPEITTIPRNFNRTELLAVFNKLVPNVQKELPSEENEDGRAAYATRSASPAPSVRTAVSCLSTTRQCARTFAASTQGDVTSRSAATPSWPTTRCDSLQSTSTGRAGALTVCRFAMCCANWDCQLH